MTTNRYGLPLTPDFNFLLRSNLLESMGQLNHVYISHAHSDHVGFLDKLDLPSPNTAIYMTETTKTLTQMQVYANKNTSLSSWQANLNNSLAQQALFDRISTVNFGDKINFGSYQVRFYQAGHIPGAMMTLFHYKKRNILYTGDYSFGATPLTDGCVLPANLKVDTLIICGTHAKHPNSWRKADALEKKCQSLMLDLQKGRDIYCKVSQLSKGVEVLKYLNKLMALYHCSYPIYIEPPIWSVIGALEKANIPILKEHNYPTNVPLYQRPHIILGSQRQEQVSSHYDYRLLDFTLHDDFEEMKAFIKKINPQQALVVHSPASPNHEDSIEQYLIRDADCQTQFIFPELQEIYRI